MCLLDSTSAFYLCYTVIQPMSYGWLLSNSCKIQSWDQLKLQRSSRQQFYKCWVSARSILFSFIYPTCCWHYRAVALSLPASTLYHPIKSHVDPPLRNVMILKGGLNTERNNLTIHSRSRHKLASLRLQSFIPPLKKKKTLFLPTYPSHHSACGRENKLRCCSGL